MGNLVPTESLPMFSKFKYDLNVRLRIREQRRIKLIKLHSQPVPPPKEERIDVLFRRPPFFQQTPVICNAAEDHVTFKDMVSLVAKPKLSGIFLNY